MRSGVPVIADDRLDGPLVCEIDPAGNLFVFDAAGAQRWKIELPAEVRTLGFPSAFCAQVWRRGHLLVAWLGPNVCAIDVLSDPPKLLWQHSTTGPVPQAMAHMGMFVRRQFMAPGLLSGADPLPLVVGPSEVYFLGERELIALDAASGKLLWKRDDIPADSFLFGDGQMLLVAPRQQGEALVVAADDGRELGRRPVPAAAGRLATLGRQIVTSREAGESCELALLDPWLQNTQWRRQLPKGTLARPVGTDELALMDPAGHLTILGLPAGNEVLHAQVAVPENLDRFHLLRSRFQYLVVAGTSPANLRAFTSNSVPITGYLHGLDRSTGARIWSAEVKDYLLRLDQPPESPVLTLLGSPQIFEQGQWRITGRLLCLDRRNGKRLYEKEAKNQQWMSYAIAARPSEHTVEIHYPQGSVKLKFAE
jgi:outer membrane protein assembly factor BamB